MLTVNNTIMCSKIRALAIILILSVSMVYGAGNQVKNYNLYLDFGAAAYTEFGFSGGPVTESNNIVTAINASGIGIETARTETDTSTNRPTALYPNSKIVYVYWNIVSINGVDVYLRIDAPLQPHDWIKETGTPADEAPSIDWNVSWEDSEYTTGSVSSAANTGERILLADIKNEEAVIVDSVRLIITADPITNIEKYIADIYSSSLILEVEQK